MELEQLAATAMGLVGPYLKKGANQLIEGLSETATGLIGSMWTGIKNGFAGSTSNQEKTSALEASPEDTDAYAAVESKLKALLEDNDELKAKLLALVTEVQREEGTDAVQSVVNQTISNNSGFAQQGNITAGRDFNVNVNSGNNPPSSNE
jgi:hypothetical protein